MTEEIKKLFEAAPGFEKSKLFESEEYEDAATMRWGMEYFLEKLYGRRISTIMEDYIEAMEKIKELESLHYFEQGYLMGRKEAQGR